MSLLTHGTLSILLTMTNLTLRTSEMRAKGFTTCHKDLATFCSATEGPRAFSQSRYLGKSFIMSDSQWMSHQLENHLGQVWVESSKCHHQSWEVKVAGFTATVTRMGMQGLQQPTLICCSLSQQQLFQSVSVAALLQAGKLVKPPNVTKISIELESYLVAGKKWNRSVKVELSKEDNSFAEDVSNSNKWVIKEYKKEHMEPLLSQLNMSADQHTRKQVQMHSVARSIAQSFERKVPSSFGKSFSYNKVYYSSIGNVPVTVEEYIPGMFEKYINNNGLISKASSQSDEVIEKASCFAHFSYVHTNMQMMVLDLQGVAYTLCDPEIASTRLLEDGELNFCAGNLSCNAIDQFFVEHICNKCCKMLALPQYKKESLPKELLDGNLEA